MTDRLWGLAEVAEYASIGETRARKLVSQPDFPTPIRLWDGAHPRWIAREVIEYCEASRAGPAPFQASLSMPLSRPRATRGDHSTLA